MEGLRQAKDTSMDVLGAFVRRATGYKEAVVPNPGDINGKKRGREGPIRIDGDSPKLSNDQTLPSSQTIASGQSEHRNRQTGASKAFSQPNKNGVPARVNVAKPNGESSVPAIRENMGKITDTKIHSSYASTSGNNGRGRFNRSDGFQNGGNHNGSTGTPTPNPNKRQKTESRQAQGPPSDVANTARPLLNRSQREQQEAVSLSARSKTQTKNTTFKGTNARRLGVARIKAVDKKGHEKPEDIEPEVISLDESDEEEVQHQVSQRVSRVTTPNAKTEAEPSNLPSTSERQNGDVKLLPSLQEIVASATSADSFCLVSGPEDILAQHLDPTGSSSRPVLPPPDQLSATTHDREDMGEHWVPTGYRMGSVETSDVGEQKRRRSRSKTPNATTHDRPKLETPPGPGPQSHIAYAQTDLPSDYQPPRSPSPEVYGHPSPIPRQIDGRPDWVDNPIVMDETDLIFLNEIPGHLRMNFVALADEIEARDEEYIDSRVEDYLVFRGWADQAVATRPGRYNVVLGAPHVVAAHRCWRSVRSAQILEAEARGVVFPYTRRPAKHQEQSGDAQVASGSNQAYAVTDQHTSSKNGSPSVSRTMPVHAYKTKSEQGTLPTTPRRMSPIVIGPSPEITEQSAPPRAIERIGTFESTVAIEVRSHTDEIQSPDHAGLERSTTREDPIEDAENRDEGEDADFELIR